MSFLLCWLLLAAIAVGQLRAGESYDFEETVSWYRQQFIQQVVTGYYQPLAEVPIAKLQAGAVVGPVTKIISDAPGDHAGLEIGDVVVGINGWHCYGFDEYDLLFDARVPGEDRMVLNVLRDGKVVDLACSHMSISGLFGFYMDEKATDKYRDIFPDGADDQVFSDVGQLLRTQGVEVRNELDLVLKDIPSRRFHELIEAKRSGDTLSWLVAWCEWYFLVVSDQVQRSQGKLAIFSKDISLPGWQEMTRFIQAVQGAHGPGQIAWDGLGVTPVYGVMHYPYPHVVLEQGDGPWHDPILAGLLESRRLRGRRGLEEREAMIRPRFQASDDLPGEHYLCRLGVALAKPRKHGGWPIRHAHIFEVDDAQELLDVLEGMPSDKDYKDPLMIQSAKVLCLVRIGKIKAALKHLREINKKSPYLAAWVDNRAVACLEYYEKYMWLQRYRSERSASVPFAEIHLRGMLEHLQAAGVIDQASMLDYSRSERYDRHIRNRTSVVFHFVGLEYYHRMQKAKRWLVYPLNEALWHLATHDQLRDPAQAVYAAKMVESVGRKYLDAAVTDSVAAAHRLQGNHWLAHRYQAKAAKRARKVQRIGPSFRQKLRRTFRL